MCSPEAVLPPLHAIGVTPRLGTVEDITGILVFLASDESLFATGNAYSIDGGMTI